jgi:DNA-binding CsgD family transcriptional regulator
LLDGGWPRALVLAGEPGIGKTTIWRELIARSGSGGWRVVTAMPSGAEVELTFSALGDVVDALGEQVLGRLPAPQRRALEVSLLRADGPAVEPRAVGVALLELLRACAAERPLLIGLDDLQWLDRPSAKALAFALRRVGDAPVAVLATLRDGEGDGPAALDLEATLGPERVARLDVGPLTMAATHELLVSCLHIEPSRSTVVSLFEATGGNPFLTTELARELNRCGIALEAGTPLPVPSSVRQLVLGRIARLAPEVRELLRVAAALARPTVELLARLRPDAGATLPAAAEAGVIEPVLGDGKVRFAHPLYARVPYEALDPPARRRLHARLAAVVDDVEESARHRALAASRPSEPVAAELDRAAATAGARGAPARAAELSALAARLTPLERRMERGLRTLAAAEWHQRAGEIERAASAANALLGTSEGDGDTRARAMALLATVRADTKGVQQAMALYDRARQQPGASAATRAEIHRRIAWLRLGQGEVASGGRHAQGALRLAIEHDPAVTAGAAAIATLADVIAGGVPPRELRVGTSVATLPTEGGPADPGLHASAATVGFRHWPETAPEILGPVTLLWAGELERARAPLERSLEHADERDEPWLTMHALAYLSAIATGVGEPQLGLDYASRYLERAQTTEQAPQRAAALWPLAFALAWLGDEQRARAAANEGLTLARESGHWLYGIGCLSALGLLELSLERSREAVDALTQARELSITRGIHSLGRLPLLPDLIEALALSGEGEDAQALAAELGRRAEALHTSWALALARRCEGLVAEASGDYERATVALAHSLAEHANCRRSGEAARTELTLGRVLRRARQKRAAREMLECSARHFDAIGSDLWASRARRELARIGGRAATPEGLSAMEASIAELVGAGQTNREVAAMLHVSPRTVEWNLSKIYQKLELRGRTELAATMASRAAKPGGSPG